METCYFGMTILLKNIQIALGEMTDINFFCSFSHCNWFGYCLNCS